MYYDCVRISYAGYGKGDIKMKREYPILEFDAESPNYISATANVSTEILLPECCVISFFGDAVKAIVQEHNCQQIGKLIMESFELPLYEIKDENGKKVVLLHGLGSGPYAAGQLEKLIALGCKKFMVCGGCGVLNKNSRIGELFVPICAIRDEGTSYHYVEAAREIILEKTVKKAICSHLEKNNIKYRCVKTWTTDAMYRETKKMIDLRVTEGCQVVEMECASYLAVAKYKGVLLGQLLYAGDDLSGEIWDGRNWKSNFETRTILLKLSINICGQLY